jgi:hypothetical protein
MSGRVGEWENGGMGEATLLPFPHSPILPFSHSPLIPTRAGIRGGGGEL